MHVPANTIPKSKTALAKFAHLSEEEVKKRSHKAVEVNKKSTINNVYSWQLFKDFQRRKMVALATQNYLDEENAKLDTAICKAETALELIEELDKEN